MNPVNPSSLNEFSCLSPPLEPFAMEESSLSTTLAVTATLAAALGSMATAYFMRRYAGPAHKNGQEDRYTRRRERRAHWREIPSRSDSNGSDDLEYCSAREISSDSEHATLASTSRRDPVDEPRGGDNNHSNSCIPQTSFRGENDTPRNAMPQNHELSTKISSQPLPQHLDYSNRSNESDASSIPSDEWFQKLLSNYNAAADTIISDPTSKSPSEELEPEEFHNTSEYIDRLGSLHHVRRSILKRQSMLLGNPDEYDEPETDEVPFRRNSSSASDVRRDTDDTEILRESSDRAVSCSCPQTCASANVCPNPKYRRPSFEPQFIARRRPSRRRFSKPGGIPSRPDAERCSLCDSITTCGEDDLPEQPQATFTFDPPAPFARRPRINFTEEDSYISETERKFKGEEGFETAVTELAHDFSSSLRLLRRTRAISALAHRLMAAPDEAACIEEVTRLMVLMFGLNRVSFAMSTGTDHFLLKRIELKRRTEEGGGDSASSSKTPSLEFEYLDSDFKRPYEGTAAGIVVKTLKEHYTPRTEFSDFPTHKVFYTQGLNSVLATPILVNGNQCMGVILLSKPEEDAFPKPDRVLISDIATLLGANIYSKRLRKASDEANKLSREMLHSFVPPKVLEKIEGFWDSNSEKYKALKSSILAQESTSTPESSVGDKSSNEEEETRSNAWYVANRDWSEAQIQEHAQKMKNRGVKDKLQMLKKLNRGESFNGEDSTGVIITTKGLDLDAELNITSRALYAENVHNVTIIFTDIVGFSRIAMGVTPIKVMNMLQNLFNRFDRLCDVHGVMKLETIGDAYLCATNLLEEDANNINVARDAAIRALAMAKDMVREARNVRIPISHEAVHVPWAAHTFDEPETLEIRVGIHVGDITCGVLGQRLPKFTICGTTVNLAARMEQTSKPSMIRVTKGFHDLVGDNEHGWLKKETVALKNMGKVESYLLDPFET